MSKEGIIEKVVDGKPTKYKIVEHVIDGNNTVKRYLVPIDTTEEDIQEGASLLDENETAGLLAKQAKPAKLLVGDQVRLLVGERDKMGTVTGKLKSGMVNVRWQDNSVGRYETKELLKVF